jgi:hypothetical protein
MPSNRFPPGRGAFGWPSIAYFVIAWLSLLLACKTIAHILP